MALGAFCGRGRSGNELDFWIIGGAVVFVKRFSCSAKVVLSIHHDSCGYKRVCTECQTDDGWPAA
jgi:hypothetical protein